MTLAAAVEQLPQLDLAMVLECFVRYLENVGHRASRAEFEANMAGKMKDPAFHGDIEPLLAGIAAYDPIAACRDVHAALIAPLAGEPWRGTR